MCYPQAVRSARPTIHRHPESLAIKPHEQGLWRLLRDRLQTVAAGANLTPDAINTSYVPP
jgi:hypothetical protein